MFLRLSSFRVRVRHSLRMRGILPCIRFLFLRTGWKPQWPGTARDIWHHKRSPRSSQPASRSPLVHPCASFLGERGLRRPSMFFHPLMFFMMLILVGSVIMLFFVV